MKRNAAKEAINKTMPKLIAAIDKCGWLPTIAMAKGIIDIQNSEWILYQIKTIFTSFTAWYKLWWLTQKTAIKKKLKIKPSK